MTSDHKIHLIGNAHIDPVWLWRWQEGFAEIKATFASALERMKEFPEFIFTCACASYYRWVEENCPEMFEEIRQRVAEGRWVVVGGWWLQPDCNMPSGESFVRHGLISQRYFQEKFGVMAKVGYNVDSFGHNGMLPQILKKSGMDFYVFMRPDASENNEVPGSLFWWESQDGSRVMTYRIPTQYGPWGWPGMPEGDLPIEKVKLLETRMECKKQGIDLMGFYGVGNHGGGPTIANLMLIEEMKKELGEGALALSSPNRYFEEMLRLGLELPVYRNDLQMHAKGCYSTVSEIKKNNRLCENRLLAAEKFAAVAASLLPFQYPADKIKGAWEKVLFNQFHDVLCGCSIKEAYQDARESHGEALNVGATVLNAAVQRISWAIDTMGGEEKKLSKETDWMYWEAEDRGTPLVVFNPLSWEVDASVALSREAAGVSDENGNAIEIQKIEKPDVNNLGKYSTLFVATLPPMGYRTYWMHLRREFTKEPAAVNLVTGANFIENKFLRLQIEPHTGYIASLYDKQNGVEVLNGKGCVPLVVDMSRWDTWAHGATEFRDVAGQFAGAEVRLTESGVLRASLRVTSRYNRSTLVQDFILYRDKAEIEVRAKLDWQERIKMLKLSFPVNVLNAEATWEIPYGFLARPADGQEAVGQAWMDLTGAATGKEGLAYGLSILNDCKYSSDIKGCDMRLTLANSSIFADHFAHGRSSEAEVMDQGVQEFCYKLVPHAGSWKDAGVVRKAWELNTPAIQVQETYHKGPLGQSMSGIGISYGNVIATAFKRAEDGNGYILRCYETCGRGAETEIEIPLLGRSWTARFGKCEIKTFSIPDDLQADVCEQNLLEM